MQAQLDIFDTPFPPMPVVDIPRARASDPSTSHESAAKVRADLRERQHRVALAVSNWPGLTACELADKIAAEDPESRGYPFWRFEVSRRAPEIRGIAVENGPARECSIAKSRQMTWNPIR